MSLPLQQSFKIHEEKLAELKGETELGRMPKPGLGLVWTLVLISSI